MKKRHPIRRWITFLLAAALVAGLAAMPMLTEGSAQEASTASILSEAPQMREMTRTLISGGTLTTVEASSVTVPSGVKLTEYLVSSGESVKAGDVLARVDDVSVMTAVKQMQESLDSVGASIQTVRNKITPGAITVDEAGDLLVNGSSISDDQIPYYAQFVTLSQQHREYEQIMLELFLLHQNGIVTAPCNGLVGELDDDMIWKLSATRQGELVFLSAVNKEPEETEPEETEPEESESEKTEPEESEPEEIEPEESEPEETEPEESEPEETKPEETVPQESYTCFVRAITAIREDGFWVTRKGTEFFTVTDLTNPGSIDESLSSEEETMLPDSPVLYYNDGEWTVIVPQAGDLLLYAEDAAGGCWTVKIGTISVTEPEEIPTDPTKPTVPGQSGSGSGSTGGRPSGGVPAGGSSSHSGTSGSAFAGGSSGYADASGSRSQSGQTPGLSSTAVSQLCTVTPMETMCLTLSVDESDIGDLECGMTAQLTLEALPYQEFTARITDISQFGTNTGGSSKYAVSLELPRAEGMLPGMNAAVTISLENLGECQTIPVAALVEQGTKTLVYTGFDEKNKILTDPVYVELGYSDGEYVQVNSGLDADALIWYSYYDTVEISNAVEKQKIFG